MVRHQRLLINNRPLDVVFGSYQLGARTITTCELGIIFNPQDAIYLGDGAAICAPGDRCSQSIGEKKALAAAMQRGFTREQREQAQEQLTQAHEALNRRPQPIPLVLDEEAGYGAGV